MSVCRDSVRPRRAKGDEDMSAAPEVTADPFDASTKRSADAIDAIAHRRGIATPSPRSLSVPSNAESAHPRRSSAGLRNEELTVT